MKILAVCGSGLGSSFMIEINIKEVLRDLELTDIEVDHSDLSGAYQGAADFFIAGKDIAESMRHLKNVIILNSLFDKDELKTKLISSLEKKGLIK